MVRRQQQEKTAGANEVFTYICIPLRLVFKVYDSPAAMSRSFTAPEIKIVMIDHLHLASKSSCEGIWSSLMATKLPTTRRSRQSIQQKIGSSLRFDRTRILFAKWAYSGQAMSRHLRFSRWHTRLHRRSDERIAEDRYLECGREDDEVLKRPKV